MSYLRKPHVVLDNRIVKAQKIESIIQLSRPFQIKDSILEIRTGSGGVASCFAYQSDMQFNITAMDVVDSRINKKSYQFQLGEGTKTSFNDESFDVIITNHVIEHVGEYEHQLVHLNEIKGLLKKAGIAYLAVPNRWMLIEPHYQLIFLSWLPKKYRSRYLKKMKNIDFYDCEPLEKKQLENLFHTIDFSYQNKTVEALRAFLKEEKQQHKSLYFIFLIIYDFLLKLFLDIASNLIYTMRNQ